MIGDAPDLPLEPRLCLPPTARARLARYLACLALRYNACMAVLDSDPVYAAGTASAGLLQRFAWAWPQCRGQASSQMAWRLRARKHGMCNSSGTVCALVQRALDAVMVAS